MFNFLNTLSVNAQKALDGILALTSGGLDERIAFWIIALTQPGSEDIELTCKTRDLCNLFSVQRNVFDAACHEMEQRNLIRYSPRKIEIVDRREMLSLLERQSETQSRKRIIHINCWRRLFAAIFIIAKKIMLKKIEHPLSIY